MRGKIVKELGVGAAFGFVVFPIVMVIGFLLNAFLEKFFGVDPMHQPVVNHLLLIKNQPGTVIPLIFLIVIIAPFLEELLFRVWLIPWLMKRSSQRTAIFLSSTLFSSLHYSKGIALSNITVIGQLFILSLFLGKVFCERRNIWAPFMMHAVVNGASLFLLLFFS